MTAPIKGCPQPDAPELVMRADGYHYRTEDEVKELTDEDLDRLMKENVPTAVRCPPGWRNAFRAAIAADRALNAPADREHQPAGTPVAWLLTDKKINDIQVDSVQRLIDRARQAHFTDLIIRINGKDEHYQADWLKHLVRATPPLNAPPPRTYEQENAVKESHRNKIADDYFDARPVFVLAPRPCFNDGFNLGWDAAKKDAPADRDVVREAVTEEMVTAYLTANDKYWRETDAQPHSNPGKWRNGTPSEATRISLEAALAAAPTPPAEQQGLANLIAALRGGRQCDEEGSEIIMSRQACVEAANFIEGAPTKKDSNNYCLILRELGMEEEGDPVAEVRRLKEKDEHHVSPSARELDMAMAIRRIVSSARRNCEDGSNVLKLANEAWSYLVRQGLEGSPLRDAGIASDSTVEQQGEQKRITTYARQSAAHQVELTAMIEERDHRETIIDELCDCVLGQDRTEWSSNYYFEDAVAEVQERILELEERKACRDSNAPALPVTLATLRAKVEALAGTAETELLYRRDVLAEIDKMGGKV